MFKFFRRKSNDVDKQQKKAPVETNVHERDETIQSDELVPQTHADDKNLDSSEPNENSSLDLQQQPQETQDQSQPQQEQPQDQDHPQEEVENNDINIGSVTALEDKAELEAGLNPQAEFETKLERAHKSEPQAEAVSETDDTAKPKSKSSWLSRLKKGLSRTGESIGSIFTSVKLDENLYEELEEALIMADSGLEATEQMLDDLRRQVKRERLTEASQAKQALKEILTKHLEKLEKPFEVGKVKPLVIMIAGVNGAGKTTSIGKMAYTLQANGASVLLAAGDTFRAAAREQLLEWGSRNNVTVIAQEGSDPAAVAFDAVNAGKARDTDVVMVDTAGRLPTQLNLMQELQKIKRVISKADETSPHEVLLVVDGNTGQNALNQIKAFDASIGLTGLIVTKLDGTAKGGVLAAVAAGSQGVRPVPVYWIGVGEGMHDLQPFVAKEFAEALIGE